MKTSCIALLSTLLLLSCAKKIKQQDDEIYSRHLQAHVKLTIISTPMPDDKSDINLLLMNDGQDFSALRIKKIIDSLYHKKGISSLVVVGITAPDRMKDYGVYGIPDYQGNGDKADKYADFIINELYPYAKKKAEVRKFKSIAIAGCSLGGLAAFDIAWDNADKINKVGVFSGSFWWRNKDANAADYNDSTDRILLSKIRSSRKKPHLQYWLYAGGKEETADRDKDGITDVVDDTKDLVNILKNKTMVASSDITYTEDANGIHDYISWSNHFPEFLKWAFPK
jgi:enterochelin esterase-like enzyme